MPNHINFPGYKITENIHNGIHSRVFRAIRTADDALVILKVFNKVLPNHEDLLIFRHQYRIVKKINIAGIEKFTSFEQHQDQFALVMLDSGSMGLDQYLQKKPIDISVFLHIAVELIKILTDLHKNQIIHKDIKPANILIHPTNKKISLIDFSISTNLPKEIQTLKNLSVIEGTLAYMSPEQTGRMNRGIDYRSDYYSLGVTFYQMLTAQLPFENEDTLSIVHSHLAKQPEALNIINPAIPGIINDIVLKLMEKNAENRYQSTRGLLDDLQNCVHQWQNNHHIVPFPLGRFDIARQFVIPEKLYGRSVEVNQLMSAFENTHQGKPMLVLVCGHSGVGKTSLINEIHKPIVKSRGYFSQGKFDQYAHNQPYSALIQALRQLVRQILEENELQLNDWNQQITLSLGEQAQVMVDLIPELEQLIGQQVEATELNGIASINRLQYLFQAFLKVFTDKQPLVLFIDDLQWIDSSSLHLLPLLLQNDSALLLIGAYRDNEVGNTHPLRITLQEIEQSKLLIDQIQLKAIDKTYVNQMINDACQYETEQTSQLSEIIIDKTQGNPFYIHRFLDLLNEESLINYDFYRSQWTFNLKQIKQLATSNDVVTFLKNRLNKLSPDSQYLLQLAACIGNCFDLKILSVIAEKSAQFCLNILHETIDKDFIVVLNEKYKIYQGLDCEELTEKIDMQFCFSHDRVQQATYSVIEQPKRADFHLRIGYLLKENSEKNKSNDYLIEMTTQLNLGKQLITEQTKRNELAQLNLLAGNKVKKATVYNTANEFYSSGIALLSKDSWKNEYKLTLKLHNAIIEVTYLMAEYQQQESFSKTTFHHTHNLLDQVHTHYFKCQRLISQGQFLETIKYALPILAQLNVEFPENPDESDIQQFFDQTNQLLTNNRIKTLIDLPLMTNETPLAAMRIISCLSVPAYVSRPNLYPLICLKQTQLSIKYGNTTESIVGYSNAAVVYTGVVGDIVLGNQFGTIALSLLATFNDNEHKSVIINNVYGGARPWSMKLKNILSHLIKGYESGQETGDLTFSCSNASWYCMLAFLSGHELSRLEEKNRFYLQVSINAKQELQVSFSGIIHQAILNLLSITKNPCKLNGKTFNEDERIQLLVDGQQQSSLAIFYVIKLMLYYWFHQNAAFEQSNQLAKQYIDALAGTHWVSIFNFYDSLSRLANYSNSSDEKQTDILAAVDTNQQQMQYWAKHAPMNFQHKWELVEAERCRIIDTDMSITLAHYENAIQGAHDHEYIQEEALANELTARFFLENNNTTIAKIYITNAYYAYANWGAKAKTHDLEKRYPDLLAPVLRSTAVVSSSINTQSVTNVQTVELDLNSVLKCSRILSGELSLSALLEKILNIVMENAGAQRSIFILNQNEQWSIAGLCEMDQHNRQILPDILLKDFQKIPQTMINHVINQQQFSVIDDVHESYHPFKNDSYFKKCSQLKSVLCLPFHSQSKLTGVIYLENNLTIGAFDDRRVEMLQMMAAQAAISIENASLYENLEEKVIDRTRQLKAAQAKLVTRAHESGMAEMAIGVLHNIGNAITPANTKTDLLLKELREDPIPNLLDQSMSELATIVAESNAEASIKERYAQFLKLLPENIHQTNDERISKLGSISERHQHIIGIVQTQMKYAKTMSMHDIMDINQVVEDAVEMQRDLLEKYSVELTTNYAQLPMVEIEQVKIVQIIVNLIKNAYEAMSETPSEHRKLMILTELTTDKNFVSVMIKDNGIGFDPADKAKLFNFGYSTKQRGTGFGLHACGNYMLAQNGHITADSNGIDKGATFTVIIPIKCKHK